MPHFFFHLRTPEGLDWDEIGLSMDSLDAAYLEACETIPEMSVDFVRRGLSPLPYAFEIADADGKRLMEVPFSERLRDGRPPRRPDQKQHARRSAEEIAATLAAAHETAERAREVLARARMT